MTSRRAGTSSTSSSAPNHVITVHDGPLRAIDEFRSEIDHESQLGRLDAAAFTAGLIDALFTEYFRQIETIERDIDALDELARPGPRRRPLPGDRVVTLRRRIARLPPGPRPEPRGAPAAGATGLRAAVRSGPGLAGDRPAPRARDRRPRERPRAARRLVRPVPRPSVAADERRDEGPDARVRDRPAGRSSLAGVMGMNFKLPFFDDAERTSSSFSPRWSSFAIAILGGRSLAPLDLTRHGHGLGGGLRCRPARPDRAGSRVRGVGGVGLVRGRLAGRRVLGDRHLAGLEALDQDLADGRDRDRQQRPDEAARRAADQDAQDHEERRDPDRVAHDERDEDVALDQLEDEVHAGDREGELRRDGRRDEDRGDRAEERPDDRDRLGDRRDQPEQERRRARRAGCRRRRSRRRSSP